MSTSVYQRFAQLPVWRQPEIQNRLSWYFQVSTNRAPAKYLLASTIPLNDDPDTLASLTLEELWETFNSHLPKLLNLWEQAKEDPTQVDIATAAETNLLDVISEIANKTIHSCTFCRWECKVDRVRGEKLGTCQLGTESRVASYFHHRGEELVFRGTRGSGTIFFSSCSMRCVFCQNSDISKDKDNGALVDPEGLAAIIWDLRMEGCHNINLVGGEPTIHLHTIMNAIRFISRNKPSREAFGQARWTKSDGFFPFRTKSSYYAYNGRFNAPILWNSNFFISETTMSLLRAVVDVWLPDFKFGNNKCARRLARTPWYFETVSKNHKLVHDWGENYVIRHLVMPNHVDCCTKPILEWIAENLSGALVNIMAQYHPDAFANPASPAYNPRYSDISRYPDRDEILEAYAYAKELGINFEEITFEKSLQ